MSLSAGEWLTVVLAVIGGLAWLFTLHGRLNTHEAVCAEFKKNQSEVLERIEARLDDEHAENKGTLRRIEGIVAELARR